MEAITILVLVGTGLYIAYKLGMFAIVRNVCDVAVGASEKYSTDEWVSGIQSDQDLGISTEEIQEAMNNRAIVKSLMEQDRRGKFKVTPKKADEPTT